MKSQWMYETQFSTHNECNSGKTCRAQLDLFYSSFSLLISFWILAYVYGSASKQKTMSVSFSYVPHAVYIFA